MQQRSKEKELFRASGIWFNYIMAQLERKWHFVKVIWCIGWIWYIHLLVKEENMTLAKH